MKRLPKYLGGTEAISLESDEKPIRISKKAKIQLAKDYIESIETGIPMDTKEIKKFLNSVGNHLRLGLGWAE